MQLDDPPSLTRIRSGIKITRRLPSSERTRSYIGGAPMLPESVQWPTLPHQILGLGNDGQNPPQDHYENVLLLQLDSDIDAMMLWEDLGALQFCISEADLRSRAFDRSFCWLSD
ncbi:DUF1963 domain-containing protein [Steroidobacter flavus]|uniref:DUF1963 domain-containing protein n=1 Tax=Steroidobacter flavus TaxID=1842136 RepID=A0ABV8SLL2_9GAMM